MTLPVAGPNAVSGTASTGRLILIRADGSVGRCGVVVVKGAALTDNEDSTFDLTFDDGS
jgi:hypothetical protein